MRSAIRQVVNAYVRSSLRMSVEQVLIHQRRGHPHTQRLITAGWAINRMNDISRSGSALYDRTPTGP
jgi:hypothetical protein